MEITYYILGKIVDEHDKDTLITIVKMIIDRHEDYFRRLEKAETENFDLILENYRLKNK
jgi:hypothetical protein